MRWDKKNAFHVKRIYRIDHNGEFSSKTSWETKENIFVTLQNREVSCICLCFYKSAHFSVKQVQQSCNTRLKLTNIWAIVQFLPSIRDWKTRLKHCGIIFQHDIAKIIRNLIQKIKMYTFWQYRIGWTVFLFSRRTMKLNFTAVLFDLQF